MDNSVSTSLIIIKKEHIEVFLIRYFTIGVDEDSFVGISGLIFTD